jgi:hypothetical protein
LTGRPYLLHVTKAKGPRSRVEYFHCALSSRDLPAVGGRRLDGLIFVGSACGFPSETTWALSLGTSPNICPRSVVCKAWDGWRIRSLCDILQRLRRGTVLHARMGRTNANTRNSDYDIVRNDHTSVSDRRRLPTIVAYMFASTLRRQLTPASLAETGASIAGHALILNLSEPSLL